MTRPLIGLYTREENCARPILGLGVQATARLFARVSGAWAEALIKVYNGTAWITRRLKVYSGGAWK